MPLPTHRADTHDLVGVGALLRRFPPPRRLIADRAYDARRFRDWLQAHGCEAVIPPNPTRKHPHQHDARVYKQRDLIERMFCLLKDFRRTATRYDKRADVFLSGVFLAAAAAWCDQLSPDPRAVLDPLARARAQSVVECRSYAHMVLSGQAIPLRG